MIFHVTMEQSDGWYVVECPALPGCVSQGRDEKEALENIKEAISGAIVALKEKKCKNLDTCCRYISIGTSALACKLYF